MPSWSTVEHILARLEAERLAPCYQTLPETEPVGWTALPAAVDPTGGRMEGARAQRKRWQVENIIRVLRPLAKPGRVIVDFGASSGNLGLPVAACFPDCQVYIVDKKPRTVEIARARLAASGLNNVTLYPGFVREVAIPFDIGLGLHLCGDGTDQAQMLCMERGAAYIMAPCCLGFINRSPLSYPRSRAFSTVIGRKEYNWIASAADWTCRDEGSELHQRGKRCMGFINTDRNLAAAEQGYGVFHCTMIPSGASPKNEMITGVPDGLSD
jgi:hypothetical protein